MRSSIAIKDIRHIQNAPVQRVEASVGGSLVWFETSDVELQPAPEAFVSAFLIPALSMKADMHVVGTISSAWRDNLEKLMTIFRKWWGYARIEIQGDGLFEAGVQRGEKTALFFSGGVDSFFSLFRSGHKIDYLIYIHGFDIPLADQDRFERFKKSLVMVAQKTDLKLVIIRTNLREHPFVAKKDWSRAHGGALAAIAHLMKDAQKFLISSSHPFCFDRPWGSHWDTDPLWATENFKILYIGGEFWRNEKLSLIADEPLVQSYLRVCWENRDTDLNCSLCEKCLRTMLILLKCNKLNRFKVFKNIDGIARNIDSIPFIPNSLFPIYEDFVRGEIPAEVKRSIQALIFRSRLRLFLRKTRLHELLMPAWLLLPWSFRQNIKKVLNCRAVFS